MDRMSKTAIPVTGTIAVARKMGGGGAQVTLPAGPARGLRRPVRHSPCLRR